MHAKFTCTVVRIMIQFSCVPDSNCWALCSLTFFLGAAFFLGAVFFFFSPPTPSITAAGASLPPSNGS